MRRKSQSPQRIALLLVLLVTQAAQLTAADYLWPLPFGKELTSIFGDYRNRRYHVGIDVRTGGEIGKVVVAPLDGYISRVRTSYFGYGKALHLKMSDGNEAVFAHLSRFTPEIEEFAREKMIASEKYTQDIELGTGRFPVQQGDTIAYSGATGVGAPHLHFEVRTPGNVPINPLSIAGLEVDDKTPPEIRRLRLIGLGNDDLARALGLNLEYEFRRKVRDTVYTLSQPLPCGAMDYWLSVEMIDKVGLSSWNKPIYKIKAGALGRELYQLQYDRIPFEQSYLIDAQRNFTLCSRGQQEFYNLVPIDWPRRYSGLCEWFDEQISPIEVLAYDIAGNYSRAIITFRRLDEREYPKPDTIKLAGLIDKYGDDFNRIGAALIPAGRRLYLLVQAPRRDASAARVRSARGAELSVRALTGRYFLSVIDSAESDGAMLSSDSLHITVQSPIDGSIETSIPVNVQRAFRNSDSEGGIRSADSRLRLKLAAPDSGFFPLEQQWYFRVDQVGSGLAARYTVIPKTVPLIHPAEYEYIFDGPVPSGASLYSIGEDLNYLGGEGDLISRSIKVRAPVLAPVTVRSDVMAPTVRMIFPRANATVIAKRPSIQFKIADDLSGVRDAIDVYVDGKWIVPVYDYETREVTAVPHFDLTSGKHKLEIRVRDRQGNLRTESMEFFSGKAIRSNQKRR